MVDWGGFDIMNKRCWWVEPDSSVERVGLLWYPDNGRTVSLFINGEFRAEVWRNLAPKVYPVINPGNPLHIRRNSPSSGRPGMRLQDVPTLRNACFEKAIDLDPPSIPQLPKLLRDEATKRKKNNFRDLYENYTPLDELKVDMGR